MGYGCVGRFSASAAAELGQHLVEEHQSPLVNCMHTQSLVGHAQVDNTVLQAARNVAWRNKLISFFARQFERVRLRDECFVAMLALMDRMTVLSTRQATPVGQCGTLTPRDTDEVFAEWLAAVLVISKQLPCEAELEISPKHIICQLSRRCGAKFSKLLPSLNCPG